LDTIHETQDLDIDREVLLPNVSDGVGVGHLSYEEIVDPNATTLPMHSTPGIDSPGIRTQTAGNEYISPVLGIPAQTISGGDHTQTQPDTLHCFVHRKFSVAGTSHDIVPRERDALHFVRSFVKI